VHSKKFDALAELIESLAGKPVLIAYAFKQDASTLLQALGVPSFTGVNGRAAHAMLAEWNAGKMPSMAIHPAGAGEGLNLQEGGHHLVWFGIPWNPAMYWQTIGRLARGGQRFSVLVHRLLVEHSIEQRMAATLLTKGANQQKLFDAARRRVD
jgi:hypothetical protein